MAAKRLNCVIYNDKEYNIVTKLHNSKPSINMNMKYIWQKQIITEEEKN